MVDLVLKLSLASSWQQRQITPKKPTWPKMQVSVLKLSLRSIWQQGQITPKDQMTKNAGLSFKTESSFELATDP